MGMKETNRAIFTAVENPAGTSADPLDRQNNFANPVKQDVRIRELSLDMDNEKDDEDSKFYTGDFTGDEAIPGISRGAVDYMVKLAPGELSGSVGAYVHKLNYSRDLKHASLTEVEIWDKLNAATKADYAYPLKRLYYPTVAASLNTLTHTVVDRDNDPAKNGNAYEVAGAMANLVLEAEGVGKPFTLKFSSKGGLEEFSIPAADLPKLAFDDDNVMKTIADSYLNTTVTITDLETAAVTTVCSQKFMLDAGNEVSETPCQQGESGVLYNENNGMKPRVSVMPQLIPLSDFNFWDGVKKAKKYRVVLESRYKTATGDIVLQVYVPRAQLLSPTITDDENKLYNELLFRPLRNTDKEIPVVNYLDNTDGETELTWDGSDLTDAQKAEATWYMVIGESVA